MRHGMMIELDLCIGCQACVTACKERWDSGPGAARDWVLELEHGQRGKDLGLTFYPGLCNHCADHPCTLDCPTGATYADENGVVVVDPEVCIGCGNCVSSCPYGARHPDERNQVVEKCNFCAPYVAAGEEPACVATCLANCRHFGDLDDPKGELMTLIKKRDAAPLVTDKVKIGPKVYYAPADKRQHVLDSGTVGEVRATSVTRFWQELSRPVARTVVPAFAVVAGVGGALVNLRARAAERKESEEQVAQHKNKATAASADGPAENAAAEEQTLPRHRFGMRFLHWFNAASWILLLVTGTALMVAPSFALFGAGPARAVSGFFGGQPNLMALHVGWGLFWAAIIVPLFLYFKRGGIEALREIKPSWDDVRWMMVKPLRMLGLTQKPLPPQDKYNAGQKAFAASALAGTTLIIGSGLVMVLHLGDATVVRTAIVVHKLAILLALVGLAVHITMAAIISEERPSLRSMFTGRVDRHHAEAHSTKWVSEIEEEHRESR